ncbi:MAG: VOC family protein [Kiritimatiellae bacterium]|nr:VOC family protein [Kiritimatiellia bacterium]
MKLEHTAIDVPDPEGAIAWWCANLGMRRSAPGGAFIVDDSGTAGLEFYRASTTPAAPDYRAADPMTLHIAFESGDIAADAARLAAAGATTVSQDIAPDGTGIAMLRDPWGVPLQLCKRAKGIFLESK